jgi:cysteine-rich repeat protein
MRTPLAAVALCVTSLLSTPAQASFHLMKVVEVFAGTQAAPDAHYVVLQMYTGGQNFVNTARVVVSDRDNATLGSFQFMANVTGGASQSRILIATPEAAAFFGVAANLAMTAVIPRSGGRVCFQNSTGSLVVDCVAWGDHPGGGTGATAVGTPFNAAGGLVLGRAMIRRLDVSGGPTTLADADDTNNCSNDFVSGTPVPRNNAGVAGTIPPSTCGNGALEGLEGCDDGNVVSGDGCTAGCADEFCGDNAVNDTVEVCDDGNARAGDGCRADCLGREVCGDGHIDTVTGEDCDDGNTDAFDGCRADCRGREVCGDGLVDPATGEDCDDANAVDTDDCLTTCVLPSCGDGFVHAGAETCEPPGTGGCDAFCQAECTADAQCGDENPCTRDERCVAFGCISDATPVDDANACTVDACDEFAGVTHDPVGDGLTCEADDDATTRDLCLGGACLASACGDGYHDAALGEQCDDGNAADGDTCESDCTLPRCGNAIRDQDEDCDDGNDDEYDDCTVSCRSVPRCDGPLPALPAECRVAVDLTVRAWLQAQLAEAAPASAFRLHLSLVGAKDPTRRVKLPALAASSGGEMVRLLTGLPVGRYYVVARSPNHLAVRTLAPIDIPRGGGPLMLDLQDPAHVAGARSLRCDALGRCALRAGDLDQSGRIDIADVVRLFAAWGATRHPTDIDANGVVGRSDLDLLLGNYREVSAAF